MISVVDADSCLGCRCHRGCQVNDRVNRVGGVIDQLHIPADLFGDGWGLVERPDRVTAILACFATADLDESVGNRLGWRLADVQIVVLEPLAYGGPRYGGAVPALRHPVAIPLFQGLRLLRQRNEEFVQQHRHIAIADNAGRGGLVVGSLTGCDLHRTNAGHDSVFGRARACCGGGGCCSDVRENTNEQCRRSRYHPEGGQAFCEPFPCLRCNGATMLVTPFMGD